MPRAKRGFKARRRRNRVLKFAQGFVAGRRRMWRRAVEAVHRAWMHAYRGRKNKKRLMRRLWIARINAGARINGTSYSRLVDALGRAGIEIDRKVLAELAVTDPGAFAKIVQTATAAA
ncbi:MAG: 50S ribosomal protein L20 [Nannocystaceae bacterium]|nr:50S ribosomal protein L20 [Nannocystaceae bacterium]